MADLQIDTESLEHAAQQLRAAVNLVEPRSARMAIEPAALGSDNVYAALDAATIQQRARANALVADLTLVNTSLTNAASAFEEQDQGFADQLEG